MWYYVYRVITNDNPGRPTVQEIGRTRFSHDALAIYDRWHSAYISHRGTIIHSKNLPETG